MVMNSRHGTSNSYCKHGVPEKEWIGRCDYIITHYGCIQCHKDRIHEQNKSFLVLWGSLLGIGFAIIGMVYFWLSVFVHGLEWWNVSGGIVCTIICCLPKILYELDDSEIQKVK